MSITRSMVFIVALVSLLLSSFASPMDLEAAQHAGHAASSPSAFIEAVRQATEPFRDVRNVPPGYGPVLGCVSGPDEGAMGVHFVNPALLLDAALDAAQPEALIYEFKNGVARLVGVEFIVFADVWHENHAPNDPPRPRRPAAAIRRQPESLRTAGASTSFTCGRGETTPTASSSTGIPASPAKGSDRSCHHLAEAIDSGVPVIHRTTRCSPPTPATTDGGGCTTA